MRPVAMPEGAAENRPRLLARQDAGQMNRALGAQGLCTLMTWALGPGWYETGIWPIIFAMPQALCLVVIHVIYGMGY